MIRFKELSWPLKLGIICGWLAAIDFCAAFLSGFVLGVVGA